MSATQWRKSSYSNDNGQCVELASKGRAVRDSKNPEGPALVFDGPAASRFLAAIKRGSLTA